MNESEESIGKKYNLAITSILLVVGLLLYMHDAYPELGWKIILYPLGALEILLSYFLFFVALELFESKKVPIKSAIVLAAYLGNSIAIYYLSDTWNGVIFPFILALLVSSASVIGYLYAKR